MTQLAARLDAALAEVQAGHKDPRCLIALYQEAAVHSVEPQQEAFFLTHAYVHALETGDARVDQIRSVLVSLGCEEPDGRA